MSDGADRRIVETSPIPDVAALGWHRRPSRGRRPQPGYGVSRVAVEHRGAYELVDDDGRTIGAVDASFRDAARTPFDFPTVGDWVVRSLEARHDRRVAIVEVLDRTSLLCRRAAGPRPQPQLVAANADILAVVTTPTPAADDRTTSATDAGHRIEWYLTAAFGGGARPVIVVNKIDTASQAECEATVEALRRRLGAAADDVAILQTCALDGRGLDGLAALAQDGATVALSGPSGVGKSSLVNRLAESEVMSVAPLSPGGRGRHTTVRRQLVPVGGPSGGTLIDTPGLQNLIPWGGEGGLVSAPDGAHHGLASVFGEIATFAQRCRFADCAHTVEPDCAVVAAVQTGELADERLGTYLELVADMGR